MMRGSVPDISLANMTLYHGTSIESARSIAIDGLVPRALSGVETLSRYQEDMKWLESVDEFVYLAAIAAPYHACQSANNKKCDLAFVAVDLDVLDPDHLFPDEDFACGTYLTATYGEGLGIRLANDRNGTLNEAHDHVRGNMPGYQHLWKDSLDQIGKIAYRGTISPGKIKKITTLALSEDQMFVLIRLCQMAMTDHYESEAAQMAVYKRIMPEVTRWMAGAWDCTADAMQTQTDRFPPEFRRMNRVVFFVLGRKQDGPSASFLWSDQTVLLINEKLIDRNPHLDICPRARVFGGTPRWIAL